MYKRKQRVGRDYCINFTQLRSEQMTHIMSMGEFMYELRRLKTGETLVIAMPYTRSDFKNRLESKLVGAIIEYYKSELAKINGQTKWVEHWASESNRLLNIEFVNEALHPIKFKDRVKAIKEAIEEIRNTDKSFRTYVINTIKKDFKIKLKKELPITALDTFIAKVLKIVDKLEN